MNRKTDVRSRIVRAAIALFSRQGYRGTSTREIARLADVSEVTLYRYFEHKEDLFWSALASCFETVKPRLDSLTSNTRSSAPGTVLPKIVSVLVDTVTFSPELVRLVAIAVLEVRGRAEEVCRNHLTPMFTAIANYLESNIEAGNLRNLDSAIMTAGIALTVFAQPELSKLIEGCRLSRLESREIVEAYTQFWLGALVPEPDKRLLKTFAPTEAISV